MSSLRLQQIRKTYPNADQETLKGINIAIESGEFLILVGPSGCGKSTLMNTIAGLEDISSGEIYIEEQEVSKVEPKDRDIAMVFQSYALYPNMTVFDNIAFGLKIRKWEKQRIDEEVNRVADMLQISHLLDRKPAHLSGGQRQRVAMGRALARKPKLYLFDEPLSNLDAKLRVDMRTQIKRLHQQLQTTIVYVTHDQIEAMTLADRIAVMKDGEVQQLGTPKEIYNQPNNLFVAGFMGSPSMNFVEVLVELNSAEQPVCKLSGKDGNEKHLALPCALRKYDGEKIVMGIRPEDIQVTESEDQDGLQLKAEVLEPTGPDILVTSRINSTEIIARCSAESDIEFGAQFSVILDVGKAVFFDKSTELRIDT
ncbi:Maltodextrin import ATP-binding protein msmX [Vibrio nigripulchritudo SO65]|uniref:ABC transporter ATP-binding protein n=1 Tax=Vibrio nigripulchritudo TaxID=28173 RepID=UPI0003B18DB0|nr:sn-glycerol-3-phosphate ABC transporter ATP-binding protein UgpC [Vibrio nigripulchritudo]CCN38340.1 Maltodextrin import ATP-binding protein msmX [Vibrio nigripulchritudo AM115]CCN43418.1 Maltodextrin import ATP-binding protein msmX [Vibrio nigripulchritudo FTn2]CCN65727.1 Maltodextrin import ATP-binding protein msmX [Vibrio nigripulchritudo POn4]CCN75273.1 Maltodextrin import ATP-binding protein msmX [Vibrio nigripulchritudo SO65]